MKEAKVIPGQSTLEVDAPTPFNPVSYLNTNDGFIDLEDLPGFNTDWERPLTYLSFMGEIGTALADEPRRSDTWDPPLDAHGEDFQKASVENLTRDLYFSPPFARSRHEVVTVGQHAPTLKAPGVRPRNEGVAVTGSEYKAIARSPSDLAQHIYANTKKANDKRPPAEKLDDETLRDTAGRSMAHVLRSYKDELLTLDNSLKIERLALSAVNALVFSDRAIERPLGELDWYRRVSALAIHGTVKVASNQLRYGTTVRWGINRALISSFHRAAPEDISASLHDYTKWAAYYIDAKRGKIYQSLSACQQEFAKHRHFLRTKKTT